MAADPAARCAGGCSSPRSRRSRCSLLAMIPALQFDYWQWLSLALATPVVLWAGLPFHRAAWRNLRHGAATMDTLVSRRHAGRVGLVGRGALLPRRRRARTCAWRSSS